MSINDKRTTIMNYEISPLTKRLLDRGLLTDDELSEAMDIYKKRKCDGGGIELREFLLPKCPKKFDTMESEFWVDAEGNRCVSIEGVHVNWKLALQYNMIEIIMPRAHLHVPANMHIPPSVKYIRLLVKTIDNFVRAPSTTRLSIRECSREGDKLLPKKIGGNCVTISKFYRGQ